MKKVLVAGAALLLAGSANAGVNISGDARVTYVGMGDYQRNESGTNGYGDYFESRVGLNFDATTASGAFAKARLHFDDAGWNDDAVWDGYKSEQVTTDLAYFGVPLGERFSVVAGKIPLNYSPFFSYYGRATRAKLVYKHNGLKLVPFIGVKSEYADNASDNWDDNDGMQYGLVGFLKMPSKWTLKWYGRYDDDAQEYDSATNLVSVDVTDAAGIVTPMMMIADEGALEPHMDHSGFTGSVNLSNSGSASTIGFTAEIAYTAADLQGTEDDGIGGYVQISKKMGAFTPAVVAGVTQNGFVADNDFGFVMVGGNESTTVVDVGTRDGDLLFAAFVANYAVSPKLSLTGNFLYADYDNNTAGNITDAIEVSAIASYALSDAASLTYKAGYLTPGFDDGDALDDAYFGHLVRLELAF